jgi:hypothetical protein
MIIQSYNQNNFVLVYSRKLLETHYIPDKKEVENLTDLNVDATQ